MHAMSFPSSTLKMVSEVFKPCCHFEISRICAQLHSCPTEAHALNLIQVAFVDVTPVAKWSPI